MMASTSRSMDMTKTIVIETNEESYHAFYKSAASTFTSTIVIDNTFRASTFGIQQTIHNLRFYLNNALSISPNPNVVRR